jgi:hypothetical protein
MRRHFYLVVDAPDEEVVGGVDIREQRYEAAKKNEQRTIQKRDLDTNEQFTETVVSLGYHDFENEGDYKERNWVVTLRKLNDIDQQHLEDAGLELEMIERKLAQAEEEQVATDGGQEQRRPFQDRLADMSDEFVEDMEMGEVMYSGRLGYHTFYDKESDRLLRGSRTVLHMAFDRTLEELWLDEDIIRDNQGEVTPDAVEAELLEQLEHFIGDGFGRGFNERFAENVRQVLEEREMAGGDE